MPQQIIAYRRWQTGFVDYTKDVEKRTDIVCIDCHNFESDNDKRDSAIVLGSSTGEYISSSKPKCAACGDTIVC